MPPLLQIESLSKSFGGSRALDAANFDLAQGEVHALVGENGAGKSTLIRILAGLEARDAGRISVRGRECELAAPKASRELGISVIHQEFDLASNLSIAENLLLGREPTRLFGFVARREEQRLARQHLDVVGLDIDGRTPVGELTVAERQLVAIAKAVSQQATILIMDEPTSALASDDVVRLLKLIVSLRQCGTSIVFVSHKLDEVFAIADRVTVFRDGSSVGTRRVNETSVSEIVSMMIGRNLADLYAKSSHARDAVALEVCRLSAPGFFQDIHFRLNQGEVLGLYGLKGSGRTAIARTIFGLASRYEGEIRLAGKRAVIESPRDAIRHGIGFVPEDRKIDGIVPNLSVGENLSLAALDGLAKLAFIDRAKERELIKENLARLRIQATDPFQAITELSGGNQQKVILGRWLAGGPRVLMLDEPTAGIDVGARADIYAIIDEFACLGAGILLISSDLPEVLGISDRLLVVYGGNIVAEFSRREASEEAIMQAIHSATAAAAAR